VAFQFCADRQTDRQTDTRTDTRTEEKRYLLRSTQLSVAHVIKMMWVYLTPKVGENAERSLPQRRGKQVVWWVLEGSPLPAELPRGSGVSPMGDFWNFRCKIWPGVGSVEGDELPPQTSSDFFLEIFSCILMHFLKNSTPATTQNVVTDHQSANYWPNKIILGAHAPCPSPLVYVSLINCRADARYAGRPS